MFCPAEFDTDSEDELDGFYFGNIVKTKTNHQIVPQQASNLADDKDELVYKAVTDDNLDVIKQFFEDNPEWKIDRPLKHGWTLLMYACADVFDDIVDYLLKERHADPNKGCMSWTPLMLACKSNESAEDVLETVKILLEHGAVINVSNDIGFTPLMYATVEGHIEVVKLFVNQASLDASDNEGITAIFHAITNKRVEICNLLLKAGADTEYTNMRGITPAKQASFSDSKEISDLFAKHVYIVPQKYYSYETIQDIVHGPNNADMPEYCPDVHVLLIGCNCVEYLQNFAENNFTIEEFLTVSDKKMQEIGIELPFARKRILLGLLRFHEKKWSLKSIKIFGSKEKLDLYDILEITAGNLKHQTILKSSLKYLTNLDKNHFIRLKEKEIQTNLKRTKELKEAIKRLRKNLQKIHNVSSEKPVELIDKNSTYCQYTLNSLCLNFSISFSILSSIVCGIFAYIYANM